jgi:uncharacterized protein YutE (UPF0331/DUF86 family)
VTPTGVRLKVVEDRLSAVAGYLARLRRLPAGSEAEFLADERTADAAESLLRRALESLLDVARHLLAKGLGEATLEYKEIARRAGERDLIADADLATAFVEMAGFRNRLTHFYREVTPGELHAIVRDRLGDVERIAAELRAAADRLTART